MNGNTDQLHIATAWGGIVVKTIDGKIAGSALPFMDEDPAIPFAVLEAGNDAVSRCIRDLLQGRKTQMPPIAPPQGTPFQRSVWNALQRIPPGETRTYAELAASIGHPGACRAAANACGRNPAPLFIPCHRVIGHDGNLRGFSAGKAWKRMLLAAERTPRF